MLAFIGWHLSHAQSVQSFDLNSDLSSSNSNPEQFIEIGSDVYFHASPNTSKSTLYKYDGTTVTEPVTLDNVYQMVELNGNIYLTGHEATLIEFDGTDTSVVVDMHYDGYSTLQEPVVANGKVYFFGIDATDGWGLFSYDGTTLTPEVDLTTGYGSGDMYDDIGGELAVGNGTLAWGFYTSANGYEPVTYDGTTLTLHDLVAGSNGSSPEAFISTSAGLFVVAEDASDNKDVWLLSGTSATKLTTAGDFENIGATADLAGVPHLLIHSSTYGDELWKYESSTLTLVEDHVAGSDGLQPYANMVEAGGKLYFSANVEPHGREIYQYDGTSISMISDLSADNTNADWYALGVTGDYIYVDESDDSTGDIRSMRYQISTDDTLTYALHPSGPENLYTPLTSGLFCARSNGNGWEPHLISGPTITQLIDLNGTTANSDPYSWAAVGSNVFFAATSAPGVGEELMVYDGTSVSLVADLKPGPEGSSPAELISYGDTLYFLLNDGDLYDLYGSELYQLDNTGTPALAVDMNGIGEESRIGNLVVHDGYLYCMAETQATGKELWKYDGTTATMLPELVTGYDDGPAGRELTSGANGLYFAGHDASGNRELYLYDPATDAYTELTSFDGFAYDIFEITPVGNHVLFVMADDNDDYDHLYHWNGTTATEVAGLPDLDDGLSRLTEHDGVLYFILDDAVNHTIYSYNPATTTLLSLHTYVVQDNEGEGNLLSTPGGLLAVFLDATTGTELHIYDAALNSFSPWYDLNPGTASPSYHYLAYLEEIDQLFVNGKFSATSGHELSVFGLCSTPDNLRAVNVQDVSATLLWDIRPGADLYRIQYKEVLASNWTTITKSTNCGTKTLTGLTASTNYRWRIAAKCGASFGPYSAVQSFGTIATPCISPSNLLTDPITPVQARLNWVGTANSLKYKFRWRAVGSGIWSGFQKDAVHNKHWLTGLTAGTAYEWQIKSICAGAPLGATWSALQTFSTPTMKQAGNFDEVLTSSNASINVQVMPNPNNGQFRLNVGSFDGQQATVHIFDPIGKLVYQQRFVGSEGYSDVVDLSRYASGTYVVRITGNAINHTSKVVVR